MTDIYTQESGSKKKFLAPVLVMLLCMTSLTVAGYAYSATVTNTDDPVIIEGLTMELKNSADQDVKTPMFEVGAYVGTHTTNGLAIYYDIAKGFKAADAAPVVYTDSFDGFLEGYYVALYNGDSANSVGYHAAITAASIDTAEELAAAIAAGSVIKLDDVYSLKVDNQTTQAVAISVKAQWAANVDAFKGLNGVFVVVKNGDDVVAVEQVGNDGTATAFSATPAAGDDITYTVEAYVALSDYYSATIPTDLAFDETFNVFFSATNPVTP